MAMEDAVVLGKAVRDLGVTAEALDAYEELRRPRVEQNIANSARMTAARTSGTTTRPAPGPEIDIEAQLDWRRPV
jgi:2-polyprenyl-6-methoxyphenol hydroxylase-like FAD-dependent oxidoreductase